MKIYSLELEDDELHFSKRPEYAFLFVKYVISTGSHICSVWLKMTQKSHSTPETLIFMTEYAKITFIHPAINAQ